MLCILSKHVIFIPKEEIIGSATSSAQCSQQFVLFLWFCFVCDVSVYRELFYLIKIVCGFRCKYLASY